MKLLSHHQMKVGGIIAVFGVALTALLIFGALAMVPPRYEASASVLLLPGENSVPESENPFLFLGGVAQARDVLVKIADSETIRADLRGDYPGVDYEVQPDLTTGAPLILLTTSGSDSDAVLALRDAVLEVLPRELEGFQNAAGSPSGSRISSMLLISDERPQRVIKSQIRAGVVAGVAGVGMMFAALAAAEALTRRRDADRRRAAPDAAGPKPRPNPKDVDDEHGLQVVDPAGRDVGPSIAETSGRAHESLRQVAERATFSRKRVVSDASPTRP
jgi:hypothetical protein